MSMYYATSDGATGRAMAALKRLALLHPKLIDLELDRSFAYSIDFIHIASFHPPFTLLEQMVKAPLLLM